MIHHLQFLLLLIVIWRDISVLQVFPEIVIRFCLRIIILLGLKRVCLKQENIKLVIGNKNTKIKIILG